MAYALKSFAQIKTDIQNSIIANQDKITDFNDGAVITAQVEAFSEELAQGYNRVDSGFRVYMRRLGYNIFDFQQKEGTAASVSVVFSRTPATPNVITIPVGTLISTSDGTIFSTTIAGTIPADTVNSASISAVAQEVGVSGNVPFESITTLITSLDTGETVTVSNPNPATGGNNRETNAEFQARFAEFILGLSKSSNHGLRSVAKQVPGVRSASTVDHSPPLSGIYNVSLYIDDGTGGATQELIDAVFLQIYGANTELNQGAKAAGVIVRIIAPTVVPVNVDVDVLDDNTLLWEVVRTNVQAAIVSYINGLGIGESFIRHKLIAAIMNVRGVVDVTMTAPAANVDPTSDQIIRAGTVVVSEA